MDMIGRKLSRRTAMGQAGLLMAGSLASSKLLSAAETQKAAQNRNGRPFLFSLNTATIRGQKLGIVKEIEIAAQAGYDAIEPWVESIDAYIKDGGALGDLKKRLNDHGLTVESAIGFPEWIVDDETKRAGGMERAKREMKLVAEIGGRRFAAPPAGATGLPKLDLSVPRNVPRPAGGRR